MEIVAWGTRGSIAISNPNSAKTGGNTTCFEVKSACLPENTHLMLDAGTGFVPAGLNYISELKNGLNYVLLFTHWHYDHIQGLTLAPPTFIDAIPMTLYGPVDSGIGPKEMVHDLFRRPYFPVDAKRITHKMKFKPLPDFDVTVIVAHPEGGFATFSRDKFVNLVAENKQLPLNGNNYEYQECLIITMAATNHGNATCITYRFHELPTNKVFVFCTDHEDMVGVPLHFRNHLEHADLLIIDGQYLQETYMESTAGFGHGTGRGIIKQALMSQVKKVGITHHDPQSTDEMLHSGVLQEAVLFKNAYASPESSLKDTDIFLVQDYMHMVV